MARLATTGFECNDVRTDGSPGFAIQLLSGATYRAGAARTGSFGIQCAAAASPDSHAQLLFTGTVGRTYYARAYVNFQSFPGSDCWVVYIGAGSMLPIFGLVVTSGGIARAYRGFSAGSQSVAQVGSDGPTLSTGTWYRVEVSLNCGVGSIDSGELRIDGVTVASASSQNWQDGVTGGMQVGYLPLSGNVTATLYTDDWAYNDDQGASQNTWPGAGNVVNLFPISDNARATLWTAGAGGTTNLWDAVDNTPPAGLASASETNTSNIEHGGGAAGTTDAYDANMTSYTSAGVAADSTVNVVSFIEVDGEDITTGSKLLKFEVLSNPTIASPGNVTAGDGAGAHGAYGGLWAIRTNQGITYAPSVTLGTSPVMRVTRPETASRVACVCFMSMVVDYTPAAGAMRVPRNPAINHQNPGIL